MQNTSDSIKLCLPFAGVITNGGAKPNIIPEEASMLYEFRTPTLGELGELEQKIRACFIGAATATGCQVGWCVVPGITLGPS